MIKFLSIFFAVNFLANWYIFSRVFAYFHLQKGWLYWLLIFGFSVSYVVMNYFDHLTGFFFSRWMLRLAGFWMGAGLILMMCIFAGDIVRLASGISIDTLRWMVLGGAGVLILYAMINVHIVRVNEITLKAPVDKTIVHLSDIHVGSVSPRHLSRLVKMANRHNPDLVLITGDLMDSSSGITPKSFESLNQIEVPIYFTTGNHERYAGLDKAMNIIGGTAVIPLRNELADLEDIQIIGIDDKEHDHQVETVLRSTVIDQSKFSIVMYHRPTGFEYAAEKGIDLMVCGHTHNGQIWPFNYVVKSRFPRVKGVHRIGQSTLVVSMGSGFWGPPMRLGSRTEIYVIRLRKGS
jgi:predicted MPP superfamily phosphohydrolase